MKLINVSNTSLSLYKGNRHRKFDAKQSKRHDFGTEVCAVCDKVFTKYHWRTKVCSEECKREKENARNRRYYKENPAKHIARKSKYYEENREKIAARSRKYYGENREKIKANYEENREKIKASYEENREKFAARSRKYYGENREKIAARSRKYYEEKSKDPEWVEKKNAKQRARYHAKKEK